MSNVLMDRVNAKASKVEGAVELPKVFTSKVKAIKSGRSKIKFDVKIYGDDEEVFNDSKIIAVPDTHYTLESILAWKDAVTEVFEEDVQKALSTDANKRKIILNSSMNKFNSDNESKGNFSVEEWILR